MPQERGSKPKILILGDQQFHHSFIDWAEGAEFLRTANREQALEMIRKGEIWAVVADPQLLRQLAPDESRPGSRRDQELVLDVIQEGVSITDLEGHIRWSNRPLRSWGPEVAELVMHFAHRTAQRIAAAEAAERTEKGEKPERSEKADRPEKSDKSDRSDRSDRGDKPREVRYSSRERTRDGRHYDVNVVPVLDAEGHVAKLVAVVLDRTPQIVLQQKISAIEEAGRKMLHLEPETMARMAPDERLTMMQRDIVTLTRNLLRYDRFSIRLLDPRTNRLELVLTEGLEKTADQRDLYAEAEGSGISGYVAATGKPYICNDVRSDPRYLPGGSDSQSSLTVPLRLNDRLVGTFNIESDQVGAFGQQDLQALDIFSYYIAQGLATLQLLVAEKVSTTHQLAADVTEELSEPLEEIQSAVLELKADYIGQDQDTINRLDHIAEAIDRIRRVVSQVTDARRPISGAMTMLAGQHQPLAGRRILVADDEPNIRKTLSEIFISLGAQVDLARDGQEAVELGQAHRYDLLLTDIRMPHKNGYEVFSEVREVHPTMPVILMTAFGYDPSHSIVRANTDGLKAVLFKPFKIQVLCEQISEALGIEIELRT